MDRRISCSITLRMAGVTRLREYRQGTEASFREILPLKERERQRERESVLAELILRNGEVNEDVQ